MSRRKVRQINAHGARRIEERFGITGASNVKAFIKNAVRFGKSPGELKDGEFKEYLLRKEYATHKRVKVYKNKIFIISRTSDNIITAYPIPEEFSCNTERKEKE